MEVTKSAHSVYSLKYHIVWVCKYRRRILNPALESYLRKVLPKLLRSMPGAEIETIGFDQDHLHMVMEIPPKYSIAGVMGRLKSQSSSVLIPSSVMVDAKLNLGKTVDASKESKRIVIEPIRESDLAVLITGISSKNLHGEISFGPAIGEEAF